MTQRTYDLVLFGATGYTGRYTAEHIVTHLPANLSWAISGRSQSKLSSIRDHLRTLNPDRNQPSIETAGLNSQDLNALAKTTKVLINCVGPYCLHGSAVIEACAKNGTHYLDVTGESPFVREMVEKYHETAKTNGAIIIPMIGLESSPADMMTYALASYIKKTISKPMREAVITITEINGGFSGGSMATMRSIFDVYSLSQIAASVKPSSICPVSLPVFSPRPLLERVLGIRSVSDLGSLTASFTAPADVPLVYRSWGIFRSYPDESYGANFRFGSYMTARNAFTGVLFRLALLVGPLIIWLKPVRWLISKLVYEQGQGPSQEEALGHRVEWKGVGIPDAETTSKAIASLRFVGSMYHLTGILVAEGAATLIYNNDTTAQKLGGGLLTPATLGQHYIDRLEKVGVAIQTRMMTS